MKWFVEFFLPSFDICSNKRISEKQSNIFKKYMKGAVKVDECADIYKDIIDGKQIILTDSIEWAGWSKGKPQKAHRYYLTITEV